MLVMKFGGTSVGDADRILAVARLARREARPVVVVTSAMSGVTDSLIRLAHLARDRKTADLETQLAALRTKHLIAADTIAPSGADSREELRSTILSLIHELEQLLHGVQMLQELSPRSLDLAASFGERLAAPLVAAAIRAQGEPSAAVDARRIVRTDDHFGSAQVDMAESRRLSREVLLPLAQQGIPVVTGYIGATAGGATTTLGRGGSDYSGALVGAFLDAREIWIWTDVDGVMTADPRVVPEARVLDAITYREAAEMAYFGSKVLHPSTMIPAVQQQIPIRVRNTFNPDHRGTIICQERKGNGKGVKTVSSIANMALVTVEGNGMIGIPGVAQRVFAATARAKANVYMISQASSEHNISLVVRRDDGVNALRELQHEFEAEINRRQIDRVDVVQPVGIMSVIGEGMRGTPGIAQRLFTALGRARLNVLAIAQGSSELNVSVVLDERDLQRAVGATHTRFGLTRDLHLVLLGKGLVGSTLIKQILEARPRLAQQQGIGLKVLGVCGRSSWLFNEHSLNDSTLAAIAGRKSLEELGGGPRPGDEELLARIAHSRRLDVVLVDVTAEDTGPLHLAALHHGLHVVTANKKPLAGPLDLYRAIRIEAQRQGVSYLFEATFGAGLPVLSTLQDLIATRDQVHRIGGCLSGTLGFLCSALDRGEPFSKIVHEARRLGYTEPDPREDLCGLDVARKAIIIARELGLELQLEQVPVEGLVTPELMGLPSIDLFMQRVGELDGPMASRVEAARREGRVLRYVAEITPAGASVGLKAVPRDSAEGHLNGPDNLLVYQTQRYHDNPLVIRGPGAGAEVTAAGVLGDILKIARAA